MKKIFVRLIATLLLVGILVGMLAACGGTNEVTVTVMDGDTVIKTITLEKGAKLDIKLADIVKAGGYECTGIFTDAEMTAALDKDATATGDITLYAAFRQKTLYLVVRNGDDEDRIAVTAGGSYTLADPEPRDGYRFLGYTYGNEDFPKTGTYTWTEDIVVKAKWQKIVYLNVIDGTNVTKYPVAADGSFSLPDVADKGDNEFNGYLNGSAPFGEFDAETGKWIGTYTGTEDLYLTHNWLIPPAETLLNPAEGVLPAGAANTVILTVGTGRLPVPTRDGFTFLGWKHGDTLFTDAAGSYTLAEGVTVSLLVASWQSVDTVGEVDGKEYFKELDASTGEMVYVFLTGTTNAYNFQGYTLSLQGNNGAVTLNAAKNGFVANKPGSFTMTITAADGSTRTVACRVENRINAFGSGKNTDAGYAANFQNGIDSVIDAGMQNLIPHILISGIHNNSTATLSLADIPFDVTVEYEVSGEYVAYTGEGYTLQNGVLTFTDSDLLGKKVRVTFVPRYALAANKASQTVVFEYLLNDGVNVYTDADLHAAFSNLAVTKINVLRDITAKLHADGCACFVGNPYGLTVCEGDHKYPYNTYDDGTANGVDIPGYLGRPFGVYQRIPTGAETLTVNGNCYKIDATGLPKLDPERGGKAWGDYSASNPYRLLNVQVGIFAVHAVKLGTVNPTVTYNDLYLQGNFNGNGSETLGSTAAGVAPMLVGSQSMHGLVARNANMNLNNSRVTHTNIALYTTGFNRGGGEAPMAEKLQAVVSLNGAQVDFSFANTLYAFGQVGVNVENSRIGSSSGAAFHFDDQPLHKLSAAQGHAGYLNLSSNSVVENYVTGAEAWFVAYGIDAIVPTLKAGINYQIANYGFTLTQKFAETGAAEFFNFISVSKDGCYFDGLSNTEEYEQTSNGAGTHYPFVQIYNGTVDPLSAGYTNGIESYYAALQGAQVNPYIFGEKLGLYVPNQQSPMGPVSMFVEVVPIQ